MARVGVYGGSFNPPHVGHVRAVQDAKRYLRLDAVLVIPAAIPPHKALAEGSPDGDTRLRLTELAFGGLDGFSVSDLELRREGASYTVDTLRQLRQERPEDELVLLMGTDMLLSFDSWREPGEICKMAELACFSRYEDADMQAALVKKELLLEQQFGTEVTLVPNDCVEISSTEIRRLLFFGCTGTYLQPAVQEEIRKLGLYGTAENCRNLPFAELKAASLRLHKEKRVPHVLGCEELASVLAERYGVDAEAARRAAILHDVTKALTAPQQLEFCRQYGIELTEFEKEQTQLLHAITAAKAAECLFGESPAVCSAIRWHTTGKADMTRLEKIIYIADMVEKTRCYPGVDAIREALSRDLDTGVMQGLERTIRHLQENGCAVAPESLQALRFLRAERM